MGSARCASPGGPPQRFAACPKPGPSPGRQRASCQPASREGGRGLRP
jgi:hypothetical protein